jgi:hypothetical protein
VASVAARALGLNNLFNLFINSPYLVWFLWVLHPECSTLHPGKSLRLLMVAGRAASRAVRSPDASAIATTAPAAPARHGRQRIPR